MRLPFSIPSLHGLVAATLLAALPARAEIDTADLGRVQATSFAPFAPDTPVTVRPLNDSDANLALKRRFAEALSKRALHVSDRRAAVVLNFETETDQAIRHDAPSFGRVHANNRESDIRVNIWSSTQGSLLGGPRGDASGRGILRFVLTATLDDTRTGQRLWQGEATYTGAAADEDAAFAAMVPILVEQLGRTIRQRSFSLE